MILIVAFCFTTIFNDFHKQGKKEANGTNNFFY